MEAYQGLNWATNFGTQAIVAFVGAFLLGYFFVETFIDQDNVTKKVIAGAFCSFCTLLLETCLLMVHESKEEMIKKKNQEREEKEKRRLIKIAEASAKAASPPPAETELSSAAPDSSEADRLDA